MIIQCPQCAACYKIDPTKTRKNVVRVKCPKCADVFQVDLPKPQGADATAPPAQVLVVDDSKFFRELILDVLRPLNLGIITAADGIEALQAIRERSPALVILDLNLPGKNGYELIREVRADASLKGTRLLAMSGVFRKETEVLEVKQAGADDFINKSFKPKQLQQRVTSLLEG